MTESIKNEKGTVKQKNKVKSKGAEFHLCVLVLEVHARSNRNWDLYICAYLLLDCEFSFLILLLLKGKLTILDVVSQYRGSEEVFKQFDEKAGVCLCCEALFDSIETVGEKYELDQTELIQALKKWISEQSDA